MSGSEFSDASHGVSAGQPVVVIEYHDGAHHGAGHHDHDAGEIGPDQGSLTAGGLHV